MIVWVSAAPQVFSSGNKVGQVLGAFDVLSGGAAARGGNFMHLLCIDATSGSPVSPAASRHARVPSSGLTEIYIRFAMPTLITPCS